jgi:glucose-6-phosphate 1-dehydrogenase
MSTDVPLEPATIVIFGVAGDLAWRKLVPALFNLFLDKRLPEPFALIGLDRQELSDAALPRRLREGVDQFSRRGSPKNADWEAFAARIGYLQTDFTDAAAYDHLGERLAKLDGEWHARANHIFYFTTPPFLFRSIATLLGKAGLAKERDRARIVVEKPLGHDLASAREINRTLSGSFHEFQIFRIDHYLGKETVQNILAFRFANPLYEPIWDRRYVDHVAITVAEEVGVEHRGGYYEQAGALRDMVQSHLLQLLCLVAMEPPVSFAADEIRNRKVDVLHAIRPITPGEVGSCAVRGQYGSGWVKGDHVAAYRDEPGVARDSNVETFAALRLFVDNWRWQGVPFYLRTGKRLPQRASEVSIGFRAVPHQTFPPEAAVNWQPARLVICIQPDEGIVLKFQAKQPGTQVRLRLVDMRFTYREAFKDCCPDAYETLLWDVMANDATPFMREDQVEAAWSLLTPVLEAWATAPPDDFPNYAAGTWGPGEAELLVARDGRSWLQPAVLTGENESGPV